MSKGYLNTTNRPLSLQISIDKGYEKFDTLMYLLNRPINTSKYLQNPKDQNILLSKTNKFSWTMHGNIIYQNMVVPEAELIKQIIVDNYSKGQKEFIVWEPGAGAFFTIEVIAKSINNAIRKGILSNDVKVTLIGTRAESNLLEEYVNIGNCELYKLGNFKYENLFEAIHDKGLDHIIGNVDFIFSNYTWQHFYDWIGALVDTYKLLKPQGIMIYHHKNLFKLQCCNSKDFDKEYDPLQTAYFIAELLHLQNNEILVKQHPDGSHYSTIIAVRKNAAELLIPMSYQENNSLNYRDYAIKLVSNIKILDTIPQYLKETYKKEFKYKIFGDKSLFCLVSKTILSQLTQDIAYITGNDNPNLLSERSNDYSNEDLENYSACDKGGYFDVPSDLLTYGERYNVKTSKELEDKLQYELTTIIDFIEERNNNNNFHYQGNEYHFYNYPDYTLIGNESTL